MNKEIPPWLSLPEEVRTRTIERFSQLTGAVKDDFYGMESKEMLLHLGRSRLLSFFKGDVQAAIKYAVDQGAAEFGVDPEEWRKSDRTVQEVLKKIMSDPEAMAQGVMLHQIAAEEMAKRN